jgi:phage terminase large subunit
VSKLNIKATPILKQLLNSKKRFVLSVGSSRSSKTYSMMQWIMLECLQNPNKGMLISVVRASFPSLRRTVYREFVDMLKSYNLYDENKHNKTEHLIEISGNYVEFFSLGDSQKIRGAKRTHLYLNEVNEIPYESAQQLFLRTEGRVFMDQNPSDVWHFSYRMKDREDVDYIHCFPGWTKVLSENGYKRIDAIKVGDKVMTRKGLKRVTKVYSNGLSYVNTYNIGGKMIDATPSHKFWSDEFGFKEIFLLPTQTTFSLYDDITNTWSNQKLNITELHSQNTQVNHISSLVVKLLETNQLDYIDIDGLEKLVTYQKDMKSTTSTEINSTTELKTSSVSQSKSIEEKQYLKDQKKVKKEDSSGLKVKKVKDQLANGLKEQTVKSYQNPNVYAEKQSIKQNTNQKRDTVQILVNQENLCQFKERKSERDNVNGVKMNLMQLGQKSNIVQKNVKVPVFDLEVEDEHEYIVEGILVSNSTYKDNPFLTKATIDQIESYKDVDENFYRVYALGLPGFATTTIYTNWKEYNDKSVKVYNEEGEEQQFYDEFCYGLDVGYGHAMALTKCHFKDDTVWVEEVIFRSGLTSNDLISLMNDMQLDKHKHIWVDAAAPAMVEDLRRAGYDAKSADKSVKEGIDMIKSKNLFINTNSTNLINEIRRYQWKSKDEVIIYEPVKVNDDLVDSMRYAIWNYYRDTIRYNNNDIDIEFLDL